MGNTGLCYPRSMAAEPPPPPDEPIGPTRPLGQLLLFPAVLVLFAAVLTAALYQYSPTSQQHPSVGVFHPGELATMNGLSGQVDLQPNPDGSWGITLRLRDQDAKSVTRATVSAHGVVGKTYLPQYQLAAADEPGLYSGWVFLRKGANRIMVHADLPGGKGDEWIAEWTLKGSADGAAE